MNILYFIILGLQMIPIWAFPYFPSQDGPAHLENAQIVLDFIINARPILHDYYVFEPVIIPNWFSHAVLAFLMLIVKPLLAEKILLSAYVILFPLSVRYAVTAIRPDSRFLAMLALPLTYNYFLHMGFYNFCFSMVFFFYAVGFWIRFCDQMSVLRILWFLIVNVVLFFTHMFSLAATWIVILGIFVTETGMLKWQLWCKKQLSIPAIWKAVGRKVLTLIVLAVPIAFLCNAYVQDRVVFVDFYKTWTELLRNLANFQVLHSFHERELIVSVLFLISLVYFGGFALRMKWKHKRYDRWDCLLGLMVFFLFLYFYLPWSMAGGHFVNDRLMIFIVFMGILWLAAQPFCDFVKKTVSKVSTALAVTLLSFHVLSYAQITPYLEEYVSVNSQIQSGKTLLPMNYSRNGMDDQGRLLSTKIWPFLHAAGYIALDTGAVNLMNYEAAHDNFPIIYREDRDPYRWMGWGLEKEPPCSSFINYPAKTGGKLDYILVWGMPHAFPHSECTQSVMHQLKMGYKSIYKSPRGGVELFERHFPH